MRSPFARSQALHERATRSIASGGNCGLRKLEMPLPFYFAYGSGPGPRNVDGNHTRDFQLGQGALLDGHAPAATAEAIAIQDYSECVRRHDGPRWAKLAAPAPLSARDRSPSHRARVMVCQLVSPRGSHRPCPRACRQRDAASRRVRARLNVIVQSKFPGQTSATARCVAAHVTRGGAPVAPPSWPHSAA